MHHICYLTRCVKKWKISCKIRRRTRRLILKALRMARADAGLTISELARRAGVSRDTISNAERGEHSLQASTLHKVARALGKAPSELLAEEERLSPKVESRSSLEPSFNDVLEEERHIAAITGLEDEIRHFTARWQDELKNAHAQDRYWCAGVQTIATGYTAIILRLDLLRKVRGIGKLDKEALRQKVTDNRSDPEFKAAMELMGAWASMHKAADEVEKAADALWGDWLAREEAEQRRKAFSVIQGEMTA
jgi:transcriptional regulator with XRE-family HTH domain